VGDPVMIIVWTDRQGGEYARLGWKGVQHQAKSRSGAITALARKLVDNGMPDWPWQAVGVLDEDHDGLRCFGRSLHRLAGLTVVDTRSGPHFRRWRPDTDAIGGEDVPDGAEAPG
jgi:hypothetical protein